MKRYEREVLRRVFEAPAPQRKRAFLRQLPRKRRKPVGLLWSQLPYIHVLSWGGSALVLAAALYVGQAGQEGSLRWLSALTPFLSMALITELSRSAAHGMEELELATRYSLRTVVMGRLVLLGLLDLVGIVLLIRLPGHGNQLCLALRLLVPYLTSALLGLRLVRQFRGVEGYLATMAAACLTGGVAMVAESWMQIPPALWLAAGLLLLLRTLQEFRILLRQTEEYVWNC